MSLGRVIRGLLRPGREHSDGSGVELHASGHGYMGCCPFHDDSTASMSVGGVPDRFRVLRSQGSSDVIDVRQTAVQPPIHP